MPVKYVTCSCADLGCNKKQYREGDKLLPGKKMCEAAFKTHKEAIKKQQATLVAGNPPPTLTEPQSQSQTVLSIEASASCRRNDQIVNTYKWSPISFDSLHRHALAVLVQAAAGSLLEGRSTNDVNRSLKAEKEKLKMSTQYSPSEVITITSQIPSTITTVLHKLGLDSEISCSVCCPTCFALYPLPPVPVKKKATGTLANPTVGASMESNLGPTEANSTVIPTPPTLLVGPAQSNSTVAPRTTLPIEPRTANLTVATTATPLVGSMAKSTAGLVNSTIVTPAMCPRTCSAVFFSQSKTYASSLSTDQALTCSAELFKTGTQPHRLFTHHSLKSWLSRVLWRPKFEDLLDASLNRPPWAPERKMYDVWDGSVWNTFEDPATPGTIYTSVSGSLVFSLYVDWFNPFRSNRKHASVGAITLVCLNLPPWERYKEENVCIYSILPGPSEPSLDEMNHVLAPLVDELQVFWKGVWFDQTFRHRNGRLIKTVVFPLIADLPALRKTAGFSGHSANFFCSFCMLPLKEIQCLDPQFFPPRIHDVHIAASLKWKAAKTHVEREQIFDQYGVRYSLLNSLPYWRPVEYCTIDLMHALLLGNIKDYCVNYLKLPEAGDSLKKQLEKQRNWALRSNSTNVFLMLDHKAPNKSSQSLKRSLEAESLTRNHDSGSQPPIQHAAKRSRKLPARATDSQSGSASQFLATHSSTEPPAQSRINSHQSPYNLRSRRTRPHPTQITHQSLQLFDSKTPILCEKSSHTQTSQNSSYKATSIRLHSVTPSITKSHSTSPDAMECDSPSDTSTVRGPLGQTNQEAIEIEVAMPATTISTPPGDTRHAKSPPARENKASRAGTHLTKRKEKAPTARIPALSQDDKKALAAESKAQAARVKKRREALWPRLSPEELEAVHIAISTTEIPSTITRVPRLIGTSGNRTLKAAEWHILFCVYFPLVLIPVWFFGEKNGRHDALLNSTARLIEITNLLSARSISNKDGLVVKDLLMQYRKLLSDHWTGSETKPNLHITQHFPEVISRFGPPASTAAWAQERLNGILGKISTNNHLPDMNKTILSQWNMKSQLLSLLHGHDELLGSLPQELLEIFCRAKSNGSGIEGDLEDRFYPMWVQLVQNYGDSGSSAVLNKRVLFFNSTELDKKKYGTESKHVGNSTIRFVHEKSLLYGRIQKIFTSTGVNDRIFFIVLPLKRLESLQPNNDPYALYPSLNAALLSSCTDESIIIDETSIRGHAIFLNNMPGTFGINEGTCCAVGITLEL